MFKFISRREKRDSSQSLCCCGGKHAGFDVHLSRTSHLPAVKLGKDDRRKSGKTQRPNYIMLVIKFSVKVIRINYWGEIKISKKY